MNKYQHLIGKKILHKSSGKIFIPNKINDIGRTYYKDIKVIKGTVYRDEGFILEEPTFSMCFKIIDEKVENWQDELQ